MPVDLLTVMRFCVAGSLFAALLGVFVRHPRAGIFLLLLPGLIDEALRQQTLGTSLFGVTVAPADAAAVCALIVSVLRLAERRVRLGRGLTGSAAVLALVAVSVARGIGDFGFQTAFNESRPYVCFLAAVLYVVTSDLGKQADRFAAVTWTVLACVFTLFCLGRWSTTGITSSSASMLVNGQVVSGRPVSAATALVIAQAGILLLTMCWRRRRLLALAVGLLLVVLLLQHRTVWVVTVVAMVAYLVLGGRAAGRQRLLVGAVVAFGGALAFLGYSAFSLSTQVGHDLQSSYTSMSGPQSSFAWRVTGWRDLLSEPRGLVDTLLGHPFGTGFARLINGHIVNVSPHNWYLQTFLRIGLVGLLTMVGVYLRALVALRSGSRADLLCRLVLLTQLIYSITYAPSMEQGVALGLVLWHLRSRGAVAPPPVPQARTSRLPQPVGVVRSA